MLALAHPHVPTPDIDGPPPMLRTSSGSGNFSRPRLDIAYRERERERERTAVAGSSDSASSTHAASSSQHRPRPNVTKEAPAPKIRSPGSGSRNKPVVDCPPSLPTLTPRSATITAGERACLDIHEYPPADLLKLLATLLQEIASSNDRLRPHSSQFNCYDLPSPTLPSPSLNPGHELTTAARESISTPTASLTFHARHIPSISLEAYLLRILKYCPTTNEVFLSLLVYFDRMSKLSTEITGKDFIIDSYNIHRLVIAGVTVASKFFSDVFYTNSRYAKVGGLPQPELNQLELQFLLLNDFNLTIAMSEMQRYAMQLVAYSSGLPSALPETVSELSVPASAPSSSAASPAGGLAVEGDETCDAYDTEDETIKPSHSSGASETSSLATAQSDMEDDGEWDGAAAAAEEDVDDDDNNHIRNRLTKTPPSHPRS